MWLKLVGADIIFDLRSLQEHNGIMSWLRWYVNWIPTFWWSCLSL